MAAEAIYIHDRHILRTVAAAATTSGEVWQLPDGRAAVLKQQNAGAANDETAWATDGVYTVIKTSGPMFLDGMPVYWDHSANAATYIPVNDRDFFIGVAVGDAEETATTARVNLNVKPHYNIQLGRDPGLSVLVGTAAAGGFGYPVWLGEAIFELTATSEAQKVDWLSKARFALSSNWIVEGIFNIMSDGSNSTQDFNIGIANATHASDADSITESCFIHVDGGSTNIAAESDDGTTEVAATDTTKDYTEGVDQAQRVHFMMDGRDPSDVQIYVNGDLVLSATTFGISAATGPLALLVHLEKSSSTDVYKVSVEHFAVRLMQQDNDMK